MPALPCRAQPDPGRARRSDEREVREGELACLGLPTRPSTSRAGSRSSCTPHRTSSRARRPASSASPRPCATTAGTASACSHSRDVELGYWLLRKAGRSGRCSNNVPFEPGQRLLDVGSNTCWASNIFARRGPRRHRARHRDGASSRARGDRQLVPRDRRRLLRARPSRCMYDPALASESLDYVFCCEVLHHNDAGEPPPHDARVLSPSPSRRPAHRRQRAAALPPCIPSSTTARRSRSSRATSTSTSPTATSSPHARRASASPRRGCAASPPDADPLLRPLVGCRRIGRWAWRHVIYGDRSLFLDCRKPG